MARKYENELGKMRTDRGEYLDKGNVAINVRHPDFNNGAVGDGINDDGVAFNLARAFLPTEGGVVLVPTGDYLLTTAFTFGGQDNVVLWLMPGVVLTGSALPTATGNNFIQDWRSGQIGSIGTVTGDVNLSSTTQSTSVTTGALVVAGGVGIAKNLNVGGTLDVTGTATAISDGFLQVQRIDGSGSSNTLLAGYSYLDMTAAATGFHVGFEARITVSATTGTVAAAASMELFQVVTGAAAITSLRGLLIQSHLQTGSGVTTTYQGIRIVDPIVTAGSITTAIGIDIDDITAGGTNFAIRTGLGSVQFGGDVLIETVTDPALAFNATSGTDQKWNMGVNSASKFFFISDVTFSQGRLQIEENGGAFKFLNGSVEMVALTASGAITVDSTTQSTSTTTGSIQTDGGLGVVLNTFLGGDLTVLGNGPHAIGKSVSGNIFLDIGASFQGDASSTFALGFRVNPIVKGAAGDTNRLAVSEFSGSVQTQTATENIGVIAQVYLSRPVITDNLTGDITVAATAYIANAPTEGETNAALYVAAGASIFAGASNVWIGPTGAAGTFVNANMTTGLIINQGAADNEILALKSSDVAHGMTSHGEADTYGLFEKSESTSGGLGIIGLKDAGGFAGLALRLFGKLGEAANTGKTTGSFGVVVVEAAIANGTAIAAVGADGNLFSIDNNGTTRFIFDADGDSHQDVGTAWTNFDDRDDALMTRSLGIYMDKSSIIKTRWDDFGRDHYEDVVGCGLMPRLTPEQIARGERALVNTTQVMRLHNGAIWQNAVSIKDGRARQDTAFCQIAVSIKDGRARQEAIENCLRHLVEANPALEGRTGALALLETTT